MPPIPIMRPSWPASSSVRWPGNKVLARAAVTHHR
jgi:hypothetical protein